MAKQKKENGDQEQDGGTVEVGGEAVTMRAPKGTSQIGLPVDNDEAIVVKVPKSGIVRVSLDVAARLAEHGFVELREDDGEEA